MSVIRAATIVVVIGVCLGLAAPARAQEPRVEIGASMASAVINADSDGGSVFGVPSGSFGLLTPGFYATFFLSRHLAVESQLGLTVATGGGDTFHAANVVGQVDYFVRGRGQNSPYLFASAGAVDFSGGGPTPVSASGGAGYRFLVGDRLVMRLDGRLTHFTDDGGNVVAITLTIGGVVR